jgi:hypothetical protein
MKATVLIAIALFGAFVSVSAQTKVWRIQSPCDKNFSVAVPAPLYEVSWFEGKHGASLEPDGGFDAGGAAYVALEETPKKRQYGLVMSDETKEKQDEYRRAGFDPNTFVIGGDDARPTSEKMVRVNGLAAENMYTHRESQPTLTRAGESFMPLVASTFWCSSRRRRKI